MKKIITMSTNNEKYKKWHKDPSNWRLGIFYFNKKDKRLFPSKGLKPMGWTINFINPRSILLFFWLIVGHSYIKI